MLNHAPGGTFYTTTGQAFQIRGRKIPMWLYRLAYRRAQRREERLGPNPTFYRVCMARHRRRTEISAETPWGFQVVYSWNDRPAQDGFAPFFAHYPYMAGWL